MAKKNILILGAGKIGTAIATLLGSAKEYVLTIADVRPVDIPIGRFVTLDVSDQKSVHDFLTHSPQHAVISCLPYDQNVFVLALAKQYGLHYFDLTEDIKTAEKAAELSQGASHAFVTQCGLAPGFINIAAHSLMQKFDTLQTAKLRVGALPATSSHALHYALTWSVEGLINQYTRPCFAIENRQSVTLQPLEGLEEVEIEGQTFEAFNTSGGLGTLAEAYEGKIDTLNYKTLRYVGHCEKMRFLLQDLKLNERRDLCKAILEHALPYTEEDRVWVYISVAGEKQGKFIEETYVKKLSPQKLGGKHWTAIQLATASGLCTVFDIVMSHPEKYRGQVLHTHFSLDEILANRFGGYFA